MEFLVVLIRELDPSLSQTSYPYSWDLEFWGLAFGLAVISDWRVELCKKKEQKIKINGIRVCLCLGQFGNSLCTACYGIPGLAQGSERGSMSRLGCGWLDAANNILRHRHRRPCIRIVESATNRSD